MMNDRIKERRKLVGLTQPELAKLIGVTKATISQWETAATSPKGENLYNLAKHLRCATDWLLFGKESKPTSNAEWAGPMETWDSNTPLNDDEVEIPFYMEVELAAGHGIAEAPHYNGPKLRFAKSTLRKSSVDPTNAACVRVSGNSMEPVLPNGSTVGVDTSQTDVSDGKMYAINHDGMLRIKTLYKLPGGGLRLRSFNLDEWPDERYEGDDLKQITVIGKVFWYSVLL
ncbi:S24 family peptidase [Shewanella frigidimarina]|uniref:S24 family peptidase n=1 Tax=Shewanella frigidimarina TaxID=56812 RepID=UPI003F9F8E9B